MLDRYCQEDERCRCFHDGPCGGERYCHLSRQSSRLQDCSMCSKLRLALGCIDVEENGNTFFDAFIGGKPSNSWPRLSWN